MKCEKCNKEYKENEVVNGICKKCLNKKRYNTAMTILIAVIISVIINLMIEVWANDNISNSSFKIESFNMETEKNTYKYTEDSVYYNGKGVVSCEDKKGDYMVLIEQINKTTNKTDYITIIVHEGKGEITTYDSSYSGVTTKPEYEFNIIGYRKFRTIL